MSGDQITRTKSCVMALDDVDSWPNELRALLAENLRLLSQYEAERARLSMLCVENVLLRVSPPENQFLAARSEILRKVDELVQDTRFIGWHCTRLHDEEIDDVQRVGLVPLDVQLLERRIDTRLRAGELSADVAQRLKSVNQARDPNRRGMIWILFTRETLQDEDGVIRLFRSWGGEALYNSHERSELTGPILREIGTPCIVEVVVPVAQIETFTTVGERVLNWYLSRHDISTGNAPQMEGVVRTPIPRESLLRVIPRGTKEFLRLTNCSGWTESF